MVGKVLGSIYDGRINNYISSLILNRLKEKHGLDFEVLAIGNYGLNTDNITAICSVKDDTESRFRVIVNKDDIKDNYLESVLIREVERALLFNLNTQGLTCKVSLDVFGKLLYGVLVVLDNYQGEAEIKAKIVRCAKKVHKELILDVYVLKPRDYHVCPNLSKSCIRRFTPVFEYRYR